MAEGVAGSRLCTFDFELLLFLFCWKRPSHFVLVNCLDGGLDEFDVLFRERFIEADKATVFTTSVLNVRRFTVKSLLYWVLRVEISRQLIIRSKETKSTLISDHVTSPPHPSNFKVTPLTNGMSPSVIVPFPSSSFLMRIL